MSSTAEYQALRLPQKVPKTIRVVWQSYLHFPILSGNTLLYSRVYCFLNRILTGIMKAKKVIENAPEKFKNSPNLGIIIENTPVNRTMLHLKTILFNLGHLKLFGSFSKQPVFSDISKAGIT